MGRPREHDQQTAEALLAAAEKLVGEGGATAVSVRSVAEQVGTTTRAVYSLFGSKEGLLQALALRANELLVTQIDRVPVTADAGADLVSAGLLGFRRFALEHPDLFRLILGSPVPSPSLAAAAGPGGWTSFARLTQRVTRARDAGLLGGRDVDEVALEWHAMCQGLAALELCDGLVASQAERVWADALNALLDGLGRRRSGGPSD